MSRAENALPVLIICQSISRRMFTTQRHAEMRDGGGESSRIDNDIRPNEITWTEFRVPEFKDGLAYG